MKPCPWCGQKDISLESYKENDDNGYIWFAYAECGICNAHGRTDDIPLLYDLCEVIGSASLCGLGTSAPNPVLSTLRHFKHEYEAHVQQPKCPAKVCRPLLTFSITSA